MFKSFFIDTISRIRKNHVIIYINLAEGIIFSLWLEYLIESYNKFYFLNNLTIPFALISFLLQSAIRTIEKKESSRFNNYFGIFIIVFEIILLIGYWQLNKISIYNIIKYIQ